MVPPCRHLITPTSCLFPVLTAMIIFVIRFEDIIWFNWVVHTEFQKIILSLIEFNIKVWLDSTALIDKSLSTSNVKSLYEICQETIINNSPKWQRTQCVSALPFSSSRRSVEFSKRQIVLLGHVTLDGKQNCQRTGDKGNGALSLWFLWLPKLEAKGSLFKNASFQETSAFALKFNFL